MPATLALFDFDGTITRRDTLFDFIHFYHGSTRFYSGLLQLSPMLVRFKLGQLPNWQAKEKMLTHFFAGETETALQQAAVKYTQQRLPTIVKESAVQRIKAFQQERADIYLVSASAEYWLRPWCATLGIQLIATRLEVKDELLTGRINGRNCHGPEKVRRIQETINLANYDQVYAFGDSSGDREMLALAHHPHYRVFT